MTRSLLLSTWLAAGLAIGSGCEDDLLADVPDAGADAPPLLEGNFACVDQPWPTTANDPLLVSGDVTTAAGSVIEGAAVEIRSIDSDALLASTTTNTGGLAPGRYQVALATGGAAARIYRKITATSYVDAHAHEPFAQFIEFRYSVPLMTPAAIDSFYQLAGMTPDPSKGVVLVHLADCNVPGQAAQVNFVAGATVEAPPGAAVIYVDENYSPAPSLAATSASGQVLILGVTPGLTDITVRAGPITYRPWPIDVRANTWHWHPRHP